MVHASGWYQAKDLELKGIAYKQSLSSFALIALDWLHPLTILLPQWLSVALVFT